jgi:Sulfotransferase family
MEAQQLIAAARRQTGLTDLGDDRILEGLNQLVAALNSEAKLTEAGAKRQEASIVATLANRLRVEDWLSKHPELLQRPIERPLFLFGLPRTGTTLAINLLHADPARRCLLRWEAFNSVPPPRAAELSTDPRCLAEQARLDLSIKYAPQIAAIHHENADSPTECQFAMSPSFCAQVYESTCAIPSYRKWFLGTSYLPAFRYHKRLLQLLQSEATGRWALKNPWHPLFLDDLTTVYPDAQLVMTHRDPVDVVGSACSLIKHVRVMYSDQVDLHAIGADMVDTFDRMIERVLAYTARHGAGSIYDLQYAALMRDPVAEIHKLYRHFDEPFSAAAGQAMRAYVANNPQGKHGRHEYTLEEFGLTRAQVRSHFDDYCRRFDIPLKN